MQLDNSLDAFCLHQVHLSLHEQGIYSVAESVRNALRGRRTDASKGRTCMSRLV